MSKYPISRFWLITAPAGHQTIRVQFDDVPVDPSRFQLGLPPDNSILVDIRFDLDREAATVHELNLQDDLLYEGPEHFTNSTHRALVHARAKELVSQLANLQELLAQFDRMKDRLQTAQKNLNVYINSTGVL